MKKILSKPENIFVIICLFWGTLFMMINPPFQAPDEDAHFFKMYGYTIGSLNFKKENNWTGQTLPSSFVSLQKYYCRYKFETDLKTSIHETSLASKIKLKKDKTEFFRFIPTSYSMISYTPGFIVLGILKLFNVNPMAMIYILRFCALLTYLALSYYAIKITPTKKWLFLLLATLPLNLYQAGAINIDGLTFGLVFLFIAYTLKLKFDEEKISPQKLIKWGALITLISVCKFAYFPLILLYFFIPKEKFESLTLHYKYFLSLFLVNAIFIISFLLHTILVSKGITTELSAITTDKFDLIKDIIKHPFTYLGAVISTTKGALDFYCKNVISGFGWSSVMIPVFASNLYYALLIMAGLYTDKSEEKYGFSIKDRTILVLSTIFIYLITITSVYLIYQRFPIIIGVQGRYLTPLLPLIFLLLTNKFVKTDNKLIPVSIVLLSQFLLFTAFLTLIARFY